MRIFSATLLLLLGACAGGPGFQASWPAHPDDRALIEARVDARLLESLAAIARLSDTLGAPLATPEEMTAAALEATAAAAALRAMSAARAAAIGPGSDARQALLFAAATAACHEGVAQVAPRIAAEPGGISPSEALRRAQLACLSSQTIRLVG